MIIGWISIVTLSLYANSTGNQGGPKSTVHLVSLAKPEPLLIRINGAKAFTEKVFPVVAEKTKMLHQDLKSYDVATYGVTIKGFGGHVHTWAEDIKLRVPVQSNDLDSEFRGAGADKAQLLSNFNFNKATLKFKFKIRSSPDLPFTALVPDLVMKGFSIKDDFDVTVDGIKGTFNVTAKRSKDFISIDSVDAFSVKVTKVSLSDTGPVTEAADLLLGFDKLFHVVGATNANEGATKLANVLLEDQLDAQKEIKKAINEALKGYSAAELTNQTVGVARGQTMQGHVNLTSLDAGYEFLRNAWQVDLAAVPGGNAPGLAFSNLARQAENPGLPAPRGDLQLYLPYSLIDKALLEMAQAGLFSQFVVPPASSGGVSTGFTMQLIPTEVPRATKYPGGIDQIAVEFPAKIANAVVATVASGLGPAGGRPVPVTLEDTSAKVAVLFKVGANDKSGVYLTVVGVLLFNLVGSLHVGPTRLNITPFQAPLQAAIMAGLTRTSPTVTLLQRTTTLLDPLKVRAGALILGTQYVRIPLTIVSG